MKAGVLSRQDLSSVAFDFLTVKTEDRRLFFND
jgi:hypothetical protein